MSVKLNKTDVQNDQDTYISERSSVLSSNKRTSQPVVPAKEPYTLQYFYNQLPENGVPLATQYKQVNEQEEELQESYRKVSPGQGNLVPLPERPPDFMANYYPYTYYSQLRYPEKPKIYQYTADGYAVPNESLDLSQYIHKPAKTPPPKTRYYDRKSHHDSTMYQYNPQKQTEEFIPQKLPKSISPPRNFNQPTPVQESSHLEPIQQQKTKIKTDTYSSESKSHRHHHHHHHHHHHPHHHRHHSPEKEYVDADFQVIDVSLKKSQRSPFFSSSNNPFQLPPPNIYNVDSYLPPVSNPLPPSNYSYSSPSLTTNWRDSIPTPKIYKSERSTNFYDHYLNKIIREKIN